MASNRNVLGCLTCRQVLNMMVILGFMTNYMLRVNLTIAIVSMVTHSNHADASHSSRSNSSSECIGRRIRIPDNGTTIGETAAAIGTSADTAKKSNDTYPPAPTLNFREHRIDGAALPLLSEDHLTGPIGMKLGPALKLRALLARKLGACTVCLHCAHCHQTPLPALNAAAAAAAAAASQQQHQPQHQQQPQQQQMPGRRPSSTGN